ncbi:MAG: type II toxin-antitoxin system ParD family antitoxin [Glaciecola sp.]|jgi:antitoxin ParD1/3/4
MSMVKKSITVTEKQNEWIQSQLSTGSYASDSELLRDLIRREQEKQSHIAEIRIALDKAETSGLSPRTPQDIMKKVLSDRGIDADI